jgi:hypothetical protein
MKHTLMPPFTRESVKVLLATAVSALLISLCAGDDACAPRRPTDARSELGDVIVRENMFGVVNAPSEACAAAARPAGRRTTGDAVSSSCIEAISTSPRAAASAFALSSRLKPSCSSAATLARWAAGLALPAGSIGANASSA